VDADSHGGLRLTSACGPILRGEESLWLRREAPAERQRRKGGAAGQAGPKPGIFTSDADRQLWEMLRGLRLSLARRQNVPPYVVFHDATLAAMVQRRPATLEAMADLPGIGERKLDAYGVAFLEVIGAAGTSPPA
jgi:ATP-dependent DNA helicase RecQ